MIRTRLGHRPIPLPLDDMDSPQRSNNPPVVAGGYPQSQEGYGANFHLSMDPLIGLKKATVLDRIVCNSD